MRLGIDFDNTILTYDRVFQHHALKLGLITTGVGRDKREIRDRIRLLPDGEAKWIELQGLVYGKHIDEAELAPGIDTFFRNCVARGARIFIISHKTRYPARGPRYDMRQAARNWIEARGLTSVFGISPEDCFFAGTLEEKLARIAASGCGCFIDDLVEVLTHPAFPPGVTKILYDANSAPGPYPDIVACGSWDEIRKTVFGA